MSRNSSKPATISAPPLVATPIHYLVAPPVTQEGFLRVAQIVGDRDRGIAPIIPVCKSTWWEGVKSGRFPKPVKLGPRTTAWRVEDIRALIAGGQ